MLLGLVSDSHDDVPLCERVASFFRERRVDMVFHLGDVTGADALAAFEGLPIVAIKGNNDHELDHLPDTWQQTFGDVRVGATHGHMRGPMKELARTCDVLLHGHTHRRRVDREGNCLVVNPGALHRTPTKTCALLELPTKVAAFYRVDEAGVTRL